MGFTNKICVVYQEYILYGKLRIFTWIYMDLPRIYGYGWGHQSDADDNMTTTNKHRSHHIALYTYIYILVGGLEHLDYFSIYWEY